MYYLHVEQKIQIEQQQPSHRLPFNCQLYTTPANGNENGKKKPNKNKQTIIISSHINIINFAEQTTAEQFQSLFSGKIAYSINVLCVSLCLLFNSLLIPLRLKKKNIYSFFIIIIYSLLKKKTLMKYHGSCGQSDRDRENEVHMLVDLKIK